MSSKEDKVRGRPKSRPRNSSPITKQLCVASGRSQRGLTAFISELPGPGVGWAQ